MPKQTINEVIGKFNIFDIFSMLIPGCVTTCLIYISLYPLKLDLFANIDADEYILAIVFSYVLGLILQEVGHILDSKLVCRFLYGGDIRSNYTLPNNKQLIFDESFSKSYFCAIKRYFIKNTNLSCKQLNDRMIFQLCSNTLEMAGVKQVADKFIVLSEMSRALAISFLGIGIVDLFIIMFYNELWKLYVTMACVCLFLSYIFIKRKKRYEVYRLKNILRTFYIKFCAKIEI